MLNLQTKDLIHMSIEVAVACILFLYFNWRYTKMHNMATALSNRVDQLERMVKLQAIALDKMAPGLLSMLNASMSQSQSDHLAVLAKPAVKPVVKPVDKPVDATADKPADTPVDKPVDTPVDKPADTLVAQASAVKPVAQASADTQPVQIIEPNHVAVRVSEDAPDSDPSPVQEHDVIEVVGNAVIDASECEHVSLKTLDKDDELSKLIQEEMAELEA
jgi:hypothetical protein